MNQIAPTTVRREVTGSLDDLRRETGLTPPAFAYPSGAHNPDALRIVQEAGFKLAFTTKRGINDLGNANPLELQRINVGAHTSLPVLRAQLLSRVMTRFGSYLAQ